MRDRTRLFTAIALLITLAQITPDAMAQDAADSDPHAADRAELLRIKADYETAVRSGELETLEPLITEEFYGVMVTGHEVQSFEELQDYWQYIRELLGEDGSYEVEVLPEPAMFDGEYAISHGTTQESVIASGRTYQFQSIWTALFVKEAGGWRILRLHASMDPITNPFVTAARKQITLMSASFGALGGLAIGGGLMWLIGKRRARSVPG